MKARMQDLDPRTIAHVQDSFAKLAPQMGLFGKAFYTRLFEDNPNIIYMFHGDPREHEFRLGAMIATIVSDLDHPERFRPMLARLGRRHVGFGVRPKDYDLYGNALKWTLAKFLGDDFGPEIESAWNDFFQFMAEEMKDGGSDLD